VLNGEVSLSDEASVDDVYRRARQLVQLHKDASALFQKGNGASLSKLLEEHGFASISEIGEELLKNFDRIRDVKVDSKVMSAVIRKDTRCSKCYGLGYVVKREYIREDGFVIPTTRFTKCACGA